MAIQTDLFAGPESDLLALLDRVPDWPGCPEKDTALIRDLQQKYPRLDLKLEFERFGDYLRDNGTQRLKGRKVNLRGRLRTWCRNAERYRGTRQGRTNGRGAHGPRAGATVPGPQDFDPSSD